jgi:hypothetical protein
MLQELMLDRTRLCVLWETYACGSMSLVVNIRSAFSELLTPESHNIQILVQTCEWKMTLTVLVSADNVLIRKKLSLRDSN